MSMTAPEACTSLAVHCQDHPGFRCVAVGRYGDEPILVVYSRKVPYKRAKRYPQEWQGFAVEVCTVGAK